MNKYGDEMTIAERMEMLDKYVIALISRIDPMTFELDGVCYDEYIFGWAESLLYKRDEVLKKEREIGQA